MTGDPGLDQRGQRVLGERRHRLGADVGGRAHLEHDAGGGEVLHQLRVLRGRDAVADALGAEVAQRVPDRLRAGGLPRVRDAVQPGGVSLGEVRRELRPRHADLRTAEAEAHQAVGLQPQGGVDRGVGAHEAELAGDVEAPAQREVELGLGRASSVLDRLAERLGRDAGLDGRVRREGQLGVADVLRGEVVGDVVRQRPDVLRRAEEVDDGEVDLDEVPEVGEVEVAGQQVGIARHRRGALVPRRELGDGADRRGSDVMDVQLRLRKTPDESHPERVSGSEVSPRSSRFCLVQRLLALSLLDAAAVGEVDLDRDDVLLAEMELHPPRLVGHVPGLGLGQPLRGAVGRR